MLTVKQKRKVWRSDSVSRVQSAAEESAPSRRSSRELSAFDSLLSFVAALERVEDDEAPYAEEEEEDFEPLRDIDMRVAWRFGPISTFRADRVFFDASEEGEAAATSTASASIASSLAAMALSLAL